MEDGVPGAEPPADVAESSPAAVLRRSPRARSSPRPRVSCVQGCMLPAASSRRDAVAAASPQRGAVQGAVGPQRGAVPAASPQRGAAQGATGHQRGATQGAGQGAPEKDEAQVSVGSGRADGPSSDQSWLQGMDPNSSFLLKIKLVGNRLKARKEMKCFSFEMTVDSDLTNYKDLVESVVEKYPPRYLEVAHVQYYDEVLKIFPEIKSDQELMDMFSKHCESKVVVMFITYRGPSDPYEPITKWDFDGDGQPENNKGNDEDDYLRNPLPQNEHVGVDEEEMYLQVVPQNESVNALQVVPFCTEKEEDQAYSDDGADSADDSEDGADSKDDSEDGADSEVEEECHEEMAYNEENQAPVIEYDPNDPPMKVGSTYRNMDGFKMALSSHAIKHQFEFNIAKSAPKRFRAYCSRKVDDKCPWWIYATTTADGCTVKVKKIHVLMTALVRGGRRR